MRLYYEYEVKYRGRNTNYYIVKKLGDYQKPPRKRDRAIQDAVYEEQIVDVIETDNYQTASNVARIIKSRKPIQAFHHSDNTVKEYTRLRMREMFGKRPNEGGTRGAILEKEWCRLDLLNNCYLPMPEADIQSFYDLFADFREGSHKQELEIVNDFKIGLITKEELA